MAYDYDRRVEASTLTWTDETSYGEDVLFGRMYVFHAITSIGWKYRLHGYSGKDGRIDSVTSWHVDVYDPQQVLRPTSRPGHLSVGGKVLRGATLNTYFSDIDQAKTEAARHFTRVSKPAVTDPAELAASLTPGQRKFIREAVENGNRVPEEFGTKSERPIRIYQTRMLNELKYTGIFYGVGLTDLGKAVAAIIR